MRGLLYRGWARPMNTTGRTADPAHFSAVDAHDPDFLIGFLDARYDLPGELRVKELIVDALELRPGLTVLDVGSGTGDDTRRIAELVTTPGGTGSVIGLDLSARMVAEARRRAVEAGVTAEFVEGDVTALPFPDATFDRTRTERTLMHIAAAETAVRELVRVTRPGGRVVASEIDAGTAFLGAAASPLTTLLEQELAAAFPSSRIGRSLMRTFVEAGLVDVRCVPMVILNSVTFIRRVIGGQLAALVEAGATSAAGATEFWTDQERGEEEGWLRTGVICFTVSGLKP
jgi:SAM-dependent methyltransferase